MAECIRPDRTFTNGDARQHGIRSELPERKRQFTEPPLQPVRFDIREVLIIHARRALVGAALRIGVSQHALAMNLFVQSIEAVIGFRLRFRV